MLGWYSIQQDKNNGGNGSTQKQEMALRKEKSDTFIETKTMQNNK